MTCTKYKLRDEGIKEDEMGGAFRNHGKGDKSLKIVGWKACRKESARRTWAQRGG
jgi:hypothetical protein